MTHAETSQTADLEALSYEQLVALLEQTLQRLESGELALEEALACYERGMAVAAACQRRLDHAELRIQRVVEGADGLTVEPWEE